MADWLTGKRVLPFHCMGSLQGREVKPEEKGSAGTRKNKGHGFIGEAEKSRPSPEEGQHAWLSWRVEQMKNYLPRSGESAFLQGL